MADHSRPSDSQSGPSDRPIPSSSQSTQRRGRSGTRLKKVTKDRNSGQKISIQFDRYWKPIGPNATQYISYVSLLARNKPSILIEEWDNVPDRVKNNIWDTIRLTYDVPDNETLRNKTWSYCCTRWRAFKTQLARMYVHNEVKEGEPRPTPCNKYPFIDEDTWEEFYRIRTTPEALLKRAKAIEIGRKNECPHTMSRGGYAKAEKDMLAAKRRRLEDQAESDPSTIVTPPSPIRREDRWKYAHQKRSGQYTSERARIIAEQIDVIKQQEVIGTFKPDRRNDVLSAAVGKPDYAGRVRGVGRGLGIRDYFGRPTSFYPSSVVPREDIDALLATVKAEARAEARAEAEASWNAKLEAALESQLEARMTKMKDEMMSMMSSKQETSVTKTQTALQSTKGSCSTIGRTSEGHAILSADPCDLYVEDPSRRLVARGSMHNLGPTVHHTQLQDDQVRVVVEEVIVADAPVPIPTDEVKTVGNAVKTFILWPKSLVHMVQAEATPVINPSAAPSNQPAVSPPQLQPHPHSQLTALQRVILMSFDRSFKEMALPMDRAVVGKDGVMVFLESDDLVALVTPKGQLTNAVVQVFLMYMHRQLVSSGKSSKFGFLCPIHIQEKGNTPSLRHKYLSQRLSEGGIECFIAPYIHGEHWQLVLLSMKTNTIVLLCSLHYKPGKELKKTMEGAMKTYQVAALGRHVHEVKDPEWITPKTRRQPKMSNLCGLYVLRHIYNVISLGVTEFNQEMFELAEPFPEEEIDFIRGRWCEYFLEFLEH